MRLYKRKRNITVILIFLLLISITPDTNIQKQNPDYPSKNQSVNVLSHKTNPFLPGKAELEKLVYIIHQQGLPERKMSRSNAMLALRQIYYSVPFTWRLSVSCKNHLPENADQASRTIIEYIHNQEDSN